MKNLEPKDVEPYLQRTTNSLAASAGRKRMMRDELFAHLFEVYLAELNHQTGNDAAVQNAVIQAALARLGDADELRQQLQASVPFYERAIFLFFNQKELTMRRAITITSFAVVLLLAAWLAFSAAMVYPNLFRHYPEDSRIRVVKNDVLEVASTDTSGSVIITMIEPYKPALIPALTVPFAILVGFALFGCYCLSRRVQGDSSSPARPITQ